MKRWRNPYERTRSADEVPSPARDAGWQRSRSRECLLMDDTSKSASGVEFRRGAARISVATLAAVAVAVVTASPFQEIDIHAKEFGYVKQRKIDWGTHAKTGQLVVVLECVSRSLATIGVTLYTVRVAFAGFSRPRSFFQVRENRCHWNNPGCWWVPH